MLCVPACVFGRPRLLPTSLCSEEGAENRGVALPGGHLWMAAQARPPETEGCWTLKDWQVGRAGALSLPTPRALMGVQSCRFRTAGDWGLTRILYLTAFRTVDMVCTQPLYVSV